MLKVLIVDDDIYSRTDIKTMLDWEKHGYMVIGEASNGSAALQMIENHIPDIVITDMYMPVMDGLELISHIDGHYPQIRVIALSAYDDFDFVRQSMKRGAVDYVLKHQLNSSTLIEILDAARSSIKKYRDEHFVSEKLSSSKDIVINEFIRKLVAGDIADKEEILGYISSLDISLETENLVVAIAEIDNFKFIEEKFSSKEIGVLLKTFLEICREILNEWEKSMIIHMDKGRFIIVFSLGVSYSMLYVYNRLSTVIDRVRTGIKRYLNITACFSVSRVYRDITEISKAYKEANTILKDKFYKGKNSIFIENSSVKHEEGFFCLDLQDEKEVASALRALDYEKVRKLIEGIFDKVLKLRLSSKSTQMICAELINIVNKVSKETGLDISRIYTSEDVPYNMLQKYETVGDIKDWILSLYEKLISMLGNMRVGSQYCEITNKIIEFVNRNYKKGISLGDAADFAGVSSSYISRVFKEDVGMGFVEYLNHIRVENAKKLIENGDDRIKEIVNKVGFNNYNYFFKVFKELVGMTPLEYDQICKKL